jgi:hypothetical protein
VALPRVDGWHRAPPTSICMLISPSQPPRPTPRPWHNSSRRQTPSGDGRTAVRARDRRADPRRPGAPQTVRGTCGPSAPTSTPRVHPTCTAARVDTVMIRVTRCLPALLPLVRVGELHRALGSRHGPMTISRVLGAVCVKTPCFRLRESGFCTFVHQPTTQRSGPLELHAT